jgi:hypothetical protein
MTFIESIYDASKTSDAGVELRHLLNALADDFDGLELFARFDCYVDDASEAAQKLWKQIKLTHSL